MLPFFGRMMDSLRNADAGQGGANPIIGQPNPIVIPVAGCLIPENIPGQFTTDAVKMEARRRLEREEEKRQQQMKVDAIRAQERLEEERIRLLAENQKARILAENAALEQEAQRRIQKREEAIEAEVQRLRNRTSIDRILEEMEVLKQEVRELKARLGLYEVVIPV